MLGALIGGLAASGSLAASATNAYAAPNACTNSPEIDGPTTWDPDSLTCSREFPATSASRPTTAGTKDMYATSKKTVNTPFNSATR